MRALGWGRGARAHPPPGEITYSKHVAPILRENCVRCHREGEIAPFTLTSYEDIAGWTETIREVVEQQRMPPWHADPAHGEFANNRRLPDEDRELLFTWIDNGAPEGDPADLPAGATRFLEVQVESTTLSPRVRLASAPTALTSAAAHADTALLPPPPSLPAMSSAHRWSAPAISPPNPAPPISSASATR